MVESNAFDGAPTCADFDVFEANAITYFNWSVQLLEWRKWLFLDPVIISKKTGLPVESEASDASMSDTEASDLFLVRSKEETTDEKRRRKSAVKEAQREARRRKKETKQLFRREQTRQQKQFAGMLSKNASVIEL